MSISTLKAWVYSLTLIKALRLLFTKTIKELPYKVDIRVGDVVLCNSPLWPTPYSKVFTQAFLIVDKLGSEEFICATFHKTYRLVTLPFILRNSSAVSFLRYEHSDTYKQAMIEAHKYLGVMAQSDLEWDIGEKTLLGSELIYACDISKRLKIHDFDKRVKRRLVTPDAIFNSKLRKIKTINASSTRP